MQRNTSREPWRDEIQEYALLIDAIASGDRHRSLKLLASYALANSGHRGLGGEGQAPHSEGEEHEYGGEGYQNDEDFAGRDVYGNGIGFAEDGSYPQNGGDLEHDFDPDEYAEYDDGSGEYHHEHGGSNGIDGAYMSGGLNQDSDQNNAYLEDGYHYSGSQMNNTGSFNGHDAYDNGFEDEEATGDFYQNQPQTLFDHQGEEWHPRNPLNSPRPVHQHESFSPEDYGETVEERDHQRGVRNENGASFAEHGDAGSSVRQFKHARRFPSPYEHASEDPDSWNHGDWADDSDGWEDESVQDENY